MRERQDVEATYQRLRHRVARLGIDVRQVSHRQTESCRRRLEDLVVGGLFALDDGIPERNRFLARLIAQSVDGAGRKNFFEGGDQPLIGELHLTSCWITD